MKKLTWFFLTVVLIVVTVSSCAPNPAPVPTSEQPTPKSIPATPVITPTPMPSPTANTPRNFEVVTQPNPQDANKTDIYIQDSETGAQSLITTLEDIAIYHYHNGEYHNGTLYILKEISYEEGDNAGQWTNELWRYDAQGQETLIHATQGLDFRVASNEDHIALTYFTEETGESRLAFKNPQGDLVQEFTLDQLGGADFPDEPSCNVDKWTDDNQALWGTLSWGPATLAYYKITVASWEIETYDVSQLSIHPAAYDFNANTGKIVYSNYPAMFDVQSVEEFEASGQPVTLFIYDFNNLSTQEIATSTAKPFKPLWLDDNRIEYDDPNGEGRIVYTVVDTPDNGS